MTKDLICLNCKNFNEDAGGCVDFTDGIPDKIIKSNKHDKPLKKQKNNIIFEPIK